MDLTSTINGGGVMKKSWIATGTSLLCAAVLMTGCGYSTKGYGTRGYDGAPHYGTRALQGPSGSGASDTTTYGTPGLGGLTTTPDYGGTAYTGRHGTTGMYGTTGMHGTTGMYGTSGYNRSVGMYGTTGYSGTSGIYGTTAAGHWTTNTSGFSTNLEHHLRKAGIYHVKVLAIGDTIILGESRHAKTRGTGQNTGTDLSSALNQVRSVVGGGARILTVSDDNAVRAMDRVKHHLNTASTHARNYSITKDLDLIVSKAIPKTSTSK